MHAKYKKFKNLLTVHNDYPWDHRGSFKQSFCYREYAIFVGNRTKTLKSCIKTINFILLTDLMEQYASMERWLTATD